MSAGKRVEAGLSPVRRRVEAVALSICGGLLWYLAVRYPACGILLGPAVVLLMLPAAVERWRAPLWGYLPGQALYFWLGHLPLQRYGMVALIVFPLLVTWSYSSQALVAAGLRRLTRLPAWITVPLAIGTGEWLRPLLDPGSFNMYQSGAFLFDYPTLIQAAEFVGASALSVLYAVPLGVAVEALRWRTGTPTANRRTVLAGVATSVAVLLPLVGWGLLTAGNNPGALGPRVAVVQPSRDHSRELTPSVVADQQRMTARWVEPGSADLIAWPENAILAPFPTDESYRAVAGWVARTREAPLLLGAQGFDPVEGRRPTNSAYLVDTEGEIAARYDKVVLFPFTERRVFPGLERVWPWAARTLVRLTLDAWRDAPDGWAAPDAVPMTASVAGEQWTFWTPICYETCFSGPARQARLAGARFFVNLTSEGWQGWGPTNNMLAVSVLRAIENRVGVVRCANSGISCFILPSGRIDQVLVGRKFGRRLLDEGALTREVRAGSAEPTFYARHGGVIDAVWVVLTALIAVIFACGRLLRRRTSPPLRGDAA